MIEATGIKEGQTCDVATSLRIQNGKRVFLKGVRGVSRRMRFLRNEAIAGDLAPELAPAVLFHEDVEADNDDWLVVGFEHIAGRAASLAPGSSDLPLVAATVNRIAELPASGFGALSDRWSGGSSWHDLVDTDPGTTESWDLPVGELIEWEEKAPGAVDGDRLIHTDLHKDQFIIDSAETVHVIDWGFPAAGAPWVDSAFLTIRLISAGHPSAEAEAWARTHLRLSEAADGQITAFAAYVAGLWSYWAVTDREPGASRRARMAREYAAYRLRVTL
ncbi:phosphotransferase family protein [Amycolatopsis sp. NPDC059021]|uniref:phosphotransferase family protein n=1 Tax=Amycolatopsis sp. NPDC059021 TaxID=3346704 RepID=UPI00366C5CCC